MTQPIGGTASTTRTSPTDGHGGVDARSSVRPRNRRAVDANAQELTSSTRLHPESRRESQTRRAISPIPRQHLSRSGETAANTPGNGQAIARHDRGRIVDSSVRSNSSTRTYGLLEAGWGASWTRLQGLANTVLGVDLNGNATEGYASDDGFRRTAHKPAMKKSTQSFWPSSGTWGVPALSTENTVIGNGTAAEREAAVRARKMARVLEIRDPVSEGLDINGRHKRRTSVEDAKPDADGEDETLVYIHPVRPSDTLAGVTLKYNCQPAVFRKANRFWPNDSIQNRKVVKLPVDACQVRGKPCEPPTTNSRSPSDNDLATGVGAASPFPDDMTVSSGQGSSYMSDEEKGYTHVRWVTLEGSTDQTPVEIGRMSRKTLGYFPPRRRKSQGTQSTQSTPRPSIEWSRKTHSFSASLDLASSPADSPKASLSGSAPAHSRQGSLLSQKGRRESVTEAADRLGWIKGPGGVGSLSKSVRRPGPAKDALNAWANKHVPGITIDSLPSTSILDHERVSFGFKEELAKIAEGRYENMVSGTATPDNLDGGKGLENAAAAVEGWFRKLAANAPGTPRLPGATRSESGDLIEMLDGTGSDDGRGFELMPGTVRATTNGSTGREDLDRVLRGRDRSVVKGKKSD